MLEAVHAASIVAARVVTTCQCHKRRCDCPAGVTHAAPQWTLTLDGRLPASMNERERSSYWTRHRELQQITDELGWDARRQNIPTAAGKRWVRITLHKSTKSRKRDDPANRDSRAKSCLDALVKLGLLIDDDDSHLEWLGVHEGDRTPTKHTLIDLGECKPDHH
jgi:hypothetical protein